MGSKRLPAWTPRPSGRHGQRQEAIFYFSETSQLLRFSCKRLSAAGGNEPGMFQCSNSGTAQTWLSCQNLGSRCTDAKQKYRGRVMEEKEKVALFLRQTKGKHNRLAPQELCPTPWWIGRGCIVRKGYVIRIKVVTVLHSSAKFQKVGVTDKVANLNFLRYVRPQGLKNSLTLFNIWLKILAKDLKGSRLNRRLSSQNGKSIPSDKNPS